MRPLFLLLFAFLYNLSTLSNALASKSSWDLRFCVNAPVLGVTTQADFSLKNIEIAAPILIPTFGEGTNRKIKLKHRYQSATRPYTGISIMKKRKLEPNLV